MSVVDPIQQQQDTIDVIWTHADRKANTYRDCVGLARAAKAIAAAAEAFAAKKGVLVAQVLAIDPKTSLDGEFSCRFVVVKKRLVSK